MIQDIYFKESIFGFIKTLKQFNKIKVKVTKRQIQIEDCIINGIRTSQDSIVIWRNKNLPIFAQVLLHELGHILTLTDKDEVTPLWYEAKTKTQKRKVLRVEYLANKMAWKLIKLLGWDLFISEKTFYEDMNFMLEQQVYYFNTGTWIYANDRIIQPSYEKHSLEYWYQIIGSGKW